MNKVDLRKSFLQQRKALDDAACEVQNALICENFFKGIDLGSVKVVHTFLPIAAQREPDTLRIIKRIRQTYPAIRIAIPRVDPGSNTLEHFYLDENQVLQKSSWGIDEHTQGERVALSDIDAIIAPLLAVDRRGQRIGYGKGYYDKFFASCPPCVKIGLSFFEPVDYIESEPHDIPLDMVITSKGIISF